MAKAIVDPEHLARFAANLRRFTADLRERSGTIQQQFARLGETWRDQEQERFAEEFTVMMAALERFSAAADAQVPVLMRKAEAIKTYLEGR